MILFAETFVLTITVVFFVSGKHVALDLLLLLVFCV